jgi:CubicO group peptidase (beta-lactamase class C family)
MEQACADDVRQITRHRARGYIKMPNGEWGNAPAIDPSNKVPGGGLCATSLDLARFAVALQSAKLLKRETLAEMCCVQKTADGKPAGSTNDQGRFMGQALGWSVFADEHGREVVRAGGKQHGVRVLLYTVPAAGCAVVLMANIGDAELDKPARQILDLLLPPETQPNLGRGP